MFEKGMRLKPAFEIKRHRILHFGNLTEKDDKTHLNDYTAALVIFVFILLSGQANADNRILPAEIEGPNNGERFSIVSDSEAKLFTKTCLSLSEVLIADEVFELEFHYLFRDTTVCESHGSHRLCRTFVLKKESNLCAEIPKLSRTLWSIPYSVVEILVDPNESLRGSSEIANLLASKHKSRSALVAYSEAGEVLILESRDAIIFAPTGE